MLRFPDGRAPDISSAMKVGAMRADLSTSEAARLRLEVRCRRLEEEALQRPQLPTAGNLSSAEEVSQTAIEAQVLMREAERLRGEKTAAKEECRRLRQQAAQDAAEIEHLAQRLQQLTEGGHRPSRSPSPVRARPMAAPSGSTAAAAQKSLPTGGCTSQAPQQEQQPGAEGGMGSPIEEPTGEGTPAAASAATNHAARSHASRPGSSPGSARLRRQAAHDAGPPASAQLGDAASGPSLDDQRQFRRELQHTLHNAERPGVVCRFPHSLGSFLALRPELEVRLGCVLGQFRTSCSMQGWAASNPRCLASSACWLHAICSSSMSFRLHSARRPSSGLS